jgi:ferric-dicitrate binding protein FerR (iron transport regulator)
VERNAEQLAWTVLCAAFAVLCLLIVAVPTGVNWYLNAAMATRTVQLDVIKGTTLWLPNGAQQEVNANGRVTLTPGEQVRTAADSEALLSFFDGSNVRLWPNTTVHVVQSQSSAFRSANTAFVLEQDGGHARYEVAIPATESRQFEVQTPQGSAVLREGSYKVEIANDETTVTVAAGSATVGNGRTAVEVLTGESTRVTGSESPGPPAPAIHNLLDGGDLNQGLDGWQPGNRNVGDSVPGNVQARSDNFRTFVEIARDAAPSPAETFIHKIVSQDVSDLDILKLSFQLRILSAAASPEGYPGDYPLVARVHYRDSSGNETTWSQNFSLESGGASPHRDAIQVIPGLWTDEVFDLFNPNVVSPRPAEILWIEFASAGTSYQSDVGNVQLLGD